MDSTSGRGEIPCPQKTRPWRRRASASRSGWTSGERRWDPDFGHISDTHRTFTLLSFLQSSILFVLSGNISQFQVGRARKMDHLPMWLQYYSKVLFDTINRSGTGVITKAATHSTAPTLWIITCWRYWIFNRAANEPSAKISQSQRRPLLPHPWLWKLCRWFVCSSNI